MNAIVNPSFNTRDRCCLVLSLAAAITCLSLYHHILFITSPLNFTWPMCWSSFASFGPWWSCNTSWPLCVPGSLVNIMPSLGCVVDMVGANTGNYVHRLCGKLRHFVKMQIFWKKHFFMFTFVLKTSCTEYKAPLSWSWNHFDIDSEGIRRKVGYRIMDHHWHELRISDTILIKFAKMEG